MFSAPSRRSLRLLSLPSPAQPTTTRALSTTPVLRAKKKSKTPINPDARSVADAHAVLRAVDATRPWSAFDLTVITRFERGNAPPRGSIALPRDPRRMKETVLVFAEGEQAQEAKDSGADIVGGEELAKDLLSGKIPLPTKVLSTTAMHPTVTKHLARFLGPKGLMPAPKRGTVTDDLASALKTATGTMAWKADRVGVIKAPVGRIHFTAEELEANVQAFVSAIREGSSADALSDAPRRTVAIKNIFLSSTQGPGIELRL